MHPHDAGGVQFRIIANVPMDDGDLGELREALRKATKVSRMADIQVANGSIDPTTLNTIIVLSSDFDDAVSRVAKMDAQAVRKEAFPDRPR